MSVRGRGLLRSRSGVCRLGYVPELLEFGWICFRMNAPARAQCDFPHPSGSGHSVPNLVGSTTCLQTAQLVGSSTAGLAAPTCAPVSAGSFTCLHGQFGLSQPPGGLPSRIWSRSLQHILSPLRLAAYVLPVPGPFVLEEIGRPLSSGRVPFLPPAAVPASGPLDPARSVELGRV